MSGIYPDSGVAAAQALNTVDVPTTNCANGELFHSTSRCQPRFDPAAANALMSELLNFMNSVGHVYDCGVLTNLSTALSLFSASCNCPPGTGIVPPVAAPAANLSRFYVDTATVPDTLYWYDGAAWNALGTNVPAWTEVVQGIVEKANAVEAAQDRKLGLSNSFAIAAPVGVLDDVRGMTPEKTYAHVRQNFFVDTAVAINLITDLRFPTPQSVMNWLSGKRITSNGSVTITIPDGAHNFAASGAMAPHPDHARILWQSATAPLPFTRAEFAAVGLTPATQAAAVAANLAVMQTKFVCSVTMPQLNYSGVSGGGCGRWTNILLVNTVVAMLGDVPQSTAFTSCVLHHATLAPLTLGKGAVCAFAGRSGILAGAARINVAQGSNLAISGATFYLQSTTLDVSFGGAVSCQSLEFTTDSRSAGINVHDCGKAAFLCADASFSGGIFPGVVAAAGSSVSFARTIGGTSNYAAIGVNAVGMVAWDGGSIAQDSNNSGSTWTVTSPQTGMHAFAAGLISLPTGGVTFSGQATVELSADREGKIINNNSVLTFGGGSADNARAATGGRIYVAAAPLPQGSIPAFGVPDATGALVY